MRNPWPTSATAEVRLSAVIAAFKDGSSEYQAAGAVERFIAGNS
jgi:hypothetical protein